MSLIIDSSAIIALALSDEDATYAEAVLSAIARDIAVAPMLFWFEVRNVLVVNERRGRITTEQTDDFLRELVSLPISLDTAPHDSDVIGLARTHRLSVYDAGYLELARRLDGQLATLDQKLRDAATTEGVTVFTNP